MASVVLFGLQVSGNAIHQMSIYGMIVALGLLIDNAIVMADEVTRNKADGFVLPVGYRIELGGAIEQDSQAKGDLITFVPILFTLVIATLILTFRSVKLALLLGVVAGLSVGLGLLATRLIDFPVSFNTILGTLGLIGLAFNNSIVVLAAIRADARARAGDPNAIADEIVGTTRHILSTTLTTIGGFLPLLLIVGGEFWPSLAIVLAGGVGGSMILALASFRPSMCSCTAETRTRKLNLR